jgi:hypothetical protein
MRSSAGGATGKAENAALSREVEMQTKLFSSVDKLTDE